MLHQLELLARPKYIINANSCILDLGLINKLQRIENRGSINLVPVSFSFLIFGVDLGLPFVELEWGLGQKSKWNFN
jgi:hypothetical protein